MSSIGEKIRKLRRMREISQEELGQAIGVTRQTISKWEADAMRPNVDNIQSLCNFFEVELSYFIDEGAVKDSAAPSPYESFAQILALRNSLMLGRAVLFAVLFALSACGCVAAAMTVYPVRINQNMLWHATDMMFSTEHVIIFAVFSALFAVLAAVHFVRYAAGRSALSDIVF